MIDGGCFAGRDLETGLGRPVEDLVADFDHFGVAVGLVGSQRSLMQDIREGIREVSAWTKQYPSRLIPVALVHPAYYGETFDQLFAWLRNELSVGIVAVLSMRSFYPVHWEEPAVRAIGEAAARQGMVLQAGIRDVSELGGVARSWGDLPVTVLVRSMAGRRYRSLASEFAVAASCPRFFFDVGNMASVGMIEQAVRRLGARRLFFASNTPYHIAGSAHAILREADLQDDAREQIATGTLTELLTLPSRRQRTASAFDVELRRIRTVPKVDIHWHPDHNNLGDTGMEREQQVALFDHWGYERVIAFANLALYHDIVTGNRLTEALCRTDARIYGMIVVDPRRVEESLTAIDDYAEHPRFVGVKTVQDVFGLGLDDPAYGPLLGRAGERGLPVLAHLTGLREAARRHPTVNFIAAHSNWGRAGHLADQPNVVFEFSTGHAEHAETQLARFIRRVGAHRVLFGSDGVLISPAWSLAKLLDAALPAEEEQRILRDNAYEVFPKLRTR